MCTTVRTLPAAQAVSRHSIWSRSVLCIRAVHRIPRALSQFGAWLRTRGGRGEGEGHRLAKLRQPPPVPVSYTHLRAHETEADL
eukprot:598012-Rhodomonas_salina.2